VLTLPLADATERLMQMANPAASLRDVLERVMQGRYAAGPGMLVAASVLARSDVRTALLQAAYDLGQVVLAQADARRDPTVVEELRGLLANLEDRFAGSNEIDPSAKRHITAQLSRARGMMALDAGEAGDGRALLAEALEQYEKLENKAGIAALALDLSAAEWSLNDASAAVEYLVKASDQLSAEQPAGVPGLQNADPGRARRASGVSVLRPAGLIVGDPACPPRDGACAERGRGVAAARKRVGARKQVRQRRRGLRAPGRARS